MTGGEAETIISSQYSIFNTRYIWIYPHKNESIEVVNKEYKIKDLKKNEKEVFVYSPGTLLLYELYKKKISLDDLSWREFEILIAELLEKEGFEITLGRGTKDGGADIIAVRKLPVTGNEITIWQAKHYKTRKVDIKAIRELGYIRQEIGGHKGIIVTTSYLTKGALGRVQKDLYLDKKDRDDVMAWMKEIWDRGL